MLSHVKPSYLYYSASNYSAGGIGSLPIIIKYHQALSGYWIWDLSALFGSAVAVGFPTVLGACPLETSGLQKDR